MTFYAGYSEANRAPTPLELGCSNPQQALPAGRVPRLRSAAAAGGRAHQGGRTARQHQHRRRPRRLEARTVPHRQRRTTSSRSRARFRAAACSRTSPPRAGRGSRPALSYQTGQYLVYANYAFIDATYQFIGTCWRHRTIRSADANGNILVTPGKQIPGIPQHQIKGGVDYWVTPQLKLGTDVIWVSSQWFVGDDANQNAKLRGLLGREPARLVSAHQGAADLRRHQQSVQSQIRDLRYLFRSAVDGHRSRYRTR